MYNKDKFSKRTYPCVFIGYSPIHKGFRRLGPKTNKVYISRHVVFDEDVFAFNSQRLTSQNENKSLSITEFADFEGWIVGENKEKTMLDKETTTNKRNSS